MNVFVIRNYALFFLVSFFSTGLSAASSSSSSDSFSSSSSSLDSDDLPPELLPEFVRMLSLEKKEVKRLGSPRKNYNSSPENSPKKFSPLLRRQKSRVTPKGTPNGTPKKLRTPLSIINGPLMENGSPMKMGSPLKRRSPAQGVSPQSTPSKLQSTPSKLPKVETPFGIKTPYRYILRLGFNRRHILELLVRNILCYEKPTNQEYCCIGQSNKNGLVDLVHFLFKIDDEKKVVVRDEFNYAEYDEAKKVVKKSELLRLRTPYMQRLREVLEENQFEDFNLFFKVIENVKNSKRSFQRACQQQSQGQQKQKKKAGQYLSLNDEIDKFIGNKHTKDSFSARFILLLETPLKPEEKAAPKTPKIGDKLKAERRKFISAILYTLANIVLNDDNRALYDLAVDIIKYYFLGPQSPHVKVLSSKKKLFLIEESDVSVDGDNKQEKEKSEEKNDSYVVAYLHNLEYSMGDNKSVMRAYIQSIESTRYYYAICFNLQAQRIDNCIDAIISKQHNSAMVEKKYEFLKKLVTELFGGYRFLSQVIEDNYRGSLRLVFEGIIEKIKKVLCEKEGQAESCLLLKHFRNLIETAKLILCFLEVKQDPFFDSRGFVDLEHIMLVTLSEDNDQIGGGHLDAKTPSKAMELKGYVLTKSPLGVGSNGVELVDWFVSQKGSGNKFKNSTLFPQCLSQDGFPTYVNELFKNIERFHYGSGDYDAKGLSVVLLGEPDKVIGLDFSRKYTYICEHDHKFLCGVSDPCLYSGLVSVIIILQRDPLFDNENSVVARERSKTITTILTMYPNAVHYFDFDAEQKQLSYQNKPINSDDDLKKVLADFKCYDEDDSGSIKKNQQGFPVYINFLEKFNYEWLLSKINEKVESCNKPKDLAHNKSELMHLDGRLFVQPDRLSYMVIKIKEGIFVKVKMPKASASSKD